MLGMPTQITVQALIDKAGGVVPLGKRLGVARTTVLDWKKNNLIPGSRIVQISQALDVPACDLLPIVQGPRSSRVAA
jgi:hypothetical protein